MKWLVVNGATRNAQCATDNLSVILLGLWNAILQLTMLTYNVAVRDDQFDSEGGAVKLCLDR